MSQNLGDIDFADNVRGALNTTLPGDLKTNALHCHAGMEVADKSEDVDDLHQIPSARSNRNQAAAALQLVPASVA